MRERDTTDFWTFDDAGTCGPAAPVEHAALSPDDRWVAVAAGDTVRVVDPHDGRIALTVRGRAVTGLAWLSPELLLVLRTGERFGVRAVVHAIPDGGALASVALPEMNARTSALSTPAPSPDGAVSAVLVGPARWHGGDRTKLRRRLGYVLQGPTWEVASTFDPDAVTGLHPLPLSRPGVAALSPDGHELVAWLGEPVPVGADPQPGHLVGLDRTTGRLRWRTRAGRSVDALVGCDAACWLLRGAAPFSPGEVLLVDTAAPSVLYDTADDPLAAQGAWPGGAPHVDLHPDRTRVVVAGFRTPAEGTPEALLAVLDVTHGLRRGAWPVPLRGVTALCAAWLGDDDALAVVTRRARHPVTLTRWDAPAAGPGARTVPVALPRGFDTPERLARSPAGGWLVLRVGARARRARRDDALVHFALRLVPASHLDA